MESGSNNKRVLYFIVNYKKTQNTHTVSDKITPPPHPPKKWPPLRNFVHKKEFGLLNSQLELPLTVSYKDFLFEFSYIYNIPITLDPAYTFPQTNAIKLSLGYIFSIN